MTQWPAKEASMQVFFIPSNQGSTNGRKLLHVMCHMPHTSRFLLTKALLLNRMQVFFISSNEGSTNGWKLLRVIPDISFRRTGEREIDR